MTTSKPIVGIGRVLLWSGGSLWIGRAGGRAAAHAHHAIQISMGLSGPLRLCGDELPWREHSIAMVRPHERHQFDGSGETVAQIFVEPETMQGRALLERHEVTTAIVDLPSDAIQSVLADLLQAFEGDAPDDTLVVISHRIIDQLCGQLPPTLSVDPRISRAIDFMRARLAEPLTLAQAAAAAHLSPSRFRHLFVAQTGMSLRAYLLWARVEAAVGAAMGGQSWTEAAQDWGFADSAHLSRTCRRMFGIAPTMLVRP